MAKIVVAYVAHGKRPANSSAMRSGSLSRGYSSAPLDDDLLNQWRRIFCSFRNLRILNSNGEPLRLVLISDHEPPVIDGRILGFYLERIGIEFHRVEHVWRPMHSNSADFFVFDVLEKIHNFADYDDQIFVCGGHALILHQLDGLYDDLNRLGILFVEDSLGAIADHHVRAIRDRLGELRTKLGLVSPDDAALIVSHEFFGITRRKLTAILASLRRLFPKNLQYAHDGHEYFRSAGELLAALFAEHGFYRANIEGLAGLAAAVPDDFVTTRLMDVPVFIPGYGQPPDLDHFFSSRLPDRIAQYDSLDQASILSVVDSEPSEPFFTHGVWRWLHIAGRRKTELIQ